MAADADQQAQTPLPGADDHRLRRTCSRAGPVDDRAGDRRRLHRVRRGAAQHVLRPSPAPSTARAAPTRGSATCTTSSSGSHSGTAMQTVDLSADLVRYGPAKSRPSTLSEGFIRDLLQVTGGGRGRSFNRSRDHAIIRMFTEGVHRRGASPAAARRPVRRPDRPLVRPRGPAEGRPRVHPRPPGPAHAEHRSGLGRVSAGPPRPPSRRAARPVAFQLYPRPAIRLRHLPDAGTPRRAGEFSTRRWSTLICSATPSPTTG